MAETDLTMPMWALAFLPFVIGMAVALIALVIYACADPLTPTRKKRG